MVEKRPALGRGLSALIPDTPSPAPATAERSLDVDTDLLRPNKFQPRTQMDDERIEDLSRSIRANGIIQPIIVRKVDQGFEIVAGERRWRAAQRAGLLKVPQDAGHCQRRLRRSPPDYGVQLGTFSTRRGGACPRPLRLVPHHSA